MSDDNSTEAKTSSPHRNRPSGCARALLEAAKSLAGPDATICFGRRPDGTFGLERNDQIAKLSAFRKFEGDLPPVLATGGEHVVYGSAVSGIIVKTALPEIFGYVVDEDKLLDERTFLQVPKLKHRHSLPSEYFVRWAILDHVFGLQTEFCGIVEQDKSCPSLVIIQPFIGSTEVDNPSWEQLEAFFDAHNFVRVDDKHIADPRIKGAVWYRQRDGLLMSDAFPRNFRIDASGVVIPIDLIVNIVPPGASKILPSAATPFQLPIS